MRFDESMLRLYAVTDRKWLKPGEKLADKVEEAIRGGVTLVQLREKELGYDEFLAEAVEVQEVCRAHGVPFVINDNVQIALEIGADGVHVGQSDMEAGNVRELLGPDRIVGVSAQTVEQAKLAESRGADYLGVGAVFPTQSKDDAVEVDRNALEAICRETGIPSVAIGGITKENLTELAGSGISGVALISAIFGQPDIEAACRELLKLSEDASGPVR